MYQIIVDKSLEKYDTQLLRTTKVGDKICVYDEDEVVLEIDCPEELNHTFEVLPNKLGYFRKDEMGEVHFTLIRYFDYHVHSEFSLLDGANKIKNIVAKSEGATAIADHGDCFGVLQHFKSMDAACKKPGIFYEAYVEDRSGNKDGNHLILGVKTEEGWKNLCKIISEAETNFYRKPHVTWEMLEKYHEGLVCTSACLGGEIPVEILKNELDAASETAETFQGIFGDDFYLEIQDHHMGTEEDVVNNALLDMAFNLDIKVVGATDSHYTDKEDAYAHEVLLAIGTKKKIYDTDRFKFEGDDYHLLTADEFEEKFLPYGEEVIENTLDMLKKCTFRFDLTKRDMPNFPIPEGFKDADEYFEHQCREGFEYRFAGDPRHDDPEYIARLEEEMALIKKTGFTGYFLIVQDYVIWAKENGIYVGPGRGSCVGSLVCFCLRITDLDPIPYGLLFERFINPERISPPDKRKKFL